MRRVQIGCVIAACLGLVACGDSKSGTGDGTTAGQNTGGAGTGGSGGDLKPGDPVDLDGDGAKDDGVAVDDDGDGQVDGVDTDGDNKSDKPLPSGGGTSGGSTGTSAGSNTTAGGTTGSDAATNEGDGLSCDGVGVCDDNFMDTCDADPDTCPATQTSGIDEPDWDCAGDPPANVYAYAKFPDGTNVAGANLAPGACVAFFEGAKGLYYAKWFKFGPKTADSTCTEYDGCVCPQAAGNNWDRRLYAFTWNGDASCDEIVLIDHKDNDPDSALSQAVSNECRKYLYAMHGDGDAGFVIDFAGDTQPAFELPFSYVAGGLPELKRRLTDFPKVEVTCVEVMGPGVPKSQLMVKDVQLNPGFVAKT